MDSSTKSFKYLSEQEDLEDPPSLRPGAYVSNGEESESAPMIKKKSLFSSLKWGSSKKKTKEKEQKYDTALYNFRKPSLNANTSTLSSSNLEDLNSRLKNFKSSRTLSHHHSSESFDEPANQRKIPLIFANHFKYTKADISQLLSGYAFSSSSQHHHEQPTSIDDKLLTMEEGGGGSNQNPLIQSLKAALKTMSDEIDSLEEKCISVEDRYMDTILQASVELQQSMNVMFQFQQKVQKLEESKNQIQSMKEDHKVVKHRLIDKEKERRIFKQQCEEKDVLIKKQSNEIVELTNILGESSEKLSQMKIDATYANTAMIELKNCKQKNKSLKEEVIRLRKLHANNSSGSFIEKSTDGDEVYSDSVVIDSIVIGLDELDQEMNEDKTEQSHEEVVKERDHLLNTVASHAKTIASMEIECAKHQDALHSTQTKLADLLAARTSDTSDTKKTSSDQNQTEELNSEREQRLQAESLLAEEKSLRIASEEKFTAADSEWKALITEVDVEMKASHQIIESLQKTKTTLTQQVDKLKQEQKQSGDSSASTPVVRELENRLIQSFADTRKAHIMIQEQKASPAFSIRVFANISDSISDDAPVLIVPNPDQISLQLKEADGGDGSTARKFIFDRVYTSVTQDKFYDGLDDYIKHAVSGKQTSLISHGQTIGNKTKLLFGEASGGEGQCIIQVAFTRLVQQLQQSEKEGKWSYEVEVSFVRILDEDILDLFCEKSDEDTKKTHDIKRTSDGSTIITNLEAVELNIHSDSEVQSVVNHTIVARHVYSESSSENSSTTLESWQLDCMQAHFVVMVKIKGTHNETGQVVDGKLTFVELAGDDVEPEDSSGSTKSANNNAKALASNKSKRSLQCFNDIITSISKRQGHIPYRNTKITYILQPSFSANGKSLLIFGLNRDQNHESALKALQFANRVYQCTINPLINQAGVGGSPNGGSAGLKNLGGASRPTSIRGVGRLKTDEKSKSRTKIKPNTPVKSTK